MPSKNTTDLSFEKNLTKLESIVQKMETGKLTLDQALQQFESGIKLTRKCQKALSQAEQRVEILIEKNNNLFTETLELEDGLDEDE